jgi:hypothetical protein
MSTSYRACALSVWTFDLARSICNTAYRPTCCGANFAAQLRPFERVGGCSRLSARGSALEPEGGRRPIVFGKGHICESILRRERRRCSMFSPIR